MRERGEQILKIVCVMLAASGFLSSRDGFCPHESTSRRHHSCAADAYCHCHQQPVDGRRARINLTALRRSGNQSRASLNGNKRRVVCDNLQYQSHY